MENTEKQTSFEEVYNRFLSKITDDMFIHSLHDLDKLVIKKEAVEIHNIINETVNSMIGDKSDVCLGEIKKATIKNADAGRIAQVIENLINNSRKYAKTEISISTEILENGKEYCLIIQDKGPGIAPDDMPFIFQKFYRGKNHGQEPGAGLGLFIVKYIMEQMDGRAELINEADGMLVKLLFKR